MANSANVAVRFDELDKEALREVARRLQRNQSDVLRELVRAALKVLQEQDPRIDQTMNPPAACDHTADEIEKSYSKGK